MKNGYKDKLEHAIGEFKHLNAMITQERRAINNTIRRNGGQETQEQSDTYNSLMNQTHKLWGGKSIDFIAKYNRSRGHSASGKYFKGGGNRSKKNTGNGLRLSMWQGHPGTMSRLHKIIDLTNLNEMLSDIDINTNI